MTDTSKMNILQAINAALFDAMADDPKVLALGEEVSDVQGGGVVGVTKGLSDAYGLDRVKGTPISEQAIIGAAIGASLAGYRPVAEIMLMNFMAVAQDMIVNHAAKLRFMSGGQTNVPIVVRTMTGTGFGTGGQHSDYLEAWYAHTPGLKVVAPSNPADAYGLMRAAIDDEDPVIYIENMPTYWNAGTVAFERGSRVPLGKAAISQPGNDVTIVAHSRMVLEALGAAKALEKDGISAEVIDLRTISPWDKDTVLSSARKTGRALIVHEATREFGIGSEIASTIGEELFGELKAPVKRLGGAFCPVPFSKPLETAFAPSQDQIATTIRSMM